MHSERDAGWFVPQAGGGRGGVEGARKEECQRCVLRRATKITGERWRVGKGLSRVST
jgi:hypothetical protein